MGLRAVTALELLAAAAPAGIVPADLFAVGAHPLRCHRAATCFERARRRAAAVAAQQRARSGSRDRVRAGKRFVLVGKTSAVDALRGLLKLVDLVDLNL